MTMTPEEKREIIEVVTSLIGPTGDYHRAITAAKVDALIDARDRFVKAGWENWLIHAALMTFITGQSTPVVFQTNGEGSSG
jgi:hypothetical protein